MASVIFIRSLTRKCNAISGSTNILRSNGVKLPPQISRAFAVASFKNSLFDSKSLHSHSTFFSSNMLNKEAQVQTSMSRASSSGDHVRLWTAERVVSATLLAVIPAAVLIPSQTMETLLALSLTIHSHWGIEALVHDYVRPSVFGDKIPKLAAASVTGISMLTFGGLCYFIWADVGIITAISMLWTL